MIKDAMEKNGKATPNGEDLEVLKKHFGMCFNSDGSLDFEKLKARLGDQVAISNEGYELKFLGKNYARLLTSLETETVMKLYNLSRDNLYQIHKRLSERLRKVMSEVLAEMDNPDMPGPLI